MPRDTSHTWVRPFKAWEYYVEPGLGVDYVDGLRWLRDGVVAGDIRVKFDGREITSLIARLLLEHRELKYPNECEHPLPPDFALNRPDIERRLKRRDTPTNKRPGRPKGAGSLAAADRELVHRMNQMISSYGTEAQYRRTTGNNLPWATFPSPWAAAKHLYESGEVPGNSKEAAIRRLVRRYHEYYGDDG